MKNAEKTEETYTERYYEDDYSDDVIPFEAIEAFFPVLVFSVIIFIDSMALIAGNTLFMLLKWSPFALIYYVIGALGVIFSLASYLAYRYLESAAAIKEENDSII